MSDKNDITIKKIDFAYGTGYSKQKNISTKKSDKPQSKITYPLLLIIHYCKKVFKYIYTKFYQLKWIISRSIFLGRGNYFKYLSHVSVLLITIAGLFAYTYHSTDSQSNSTSRFSGIAQANDGILSATEGSSPLNRVVNDVIQYKVQEGDTLVSIAQKFSSEGNEISADSIVWANNLKIDETLKPGSMLEIPPVTGTLHVVKDGDTIIDIAKKYKRIDDKSAPEDIDAVMQDIVDMNMLDIVHDTGDKKIPVLVAGQRLIIPGGSISIDTSKQKVASLGNSVGQKTSMDIKEVFSSGLIWPISIRGKITKTYSTYHKAIDIADRSRPPVVAVADGIIVSAEWEGLAGCAIRLKISDSITVLYGHVGVSEKINGKIIIDCKFLVKKGQKVKQGDYLGYMGNTGEVTGVHTHFIIFKNGAPMHPCLMLKC